MTTNIKSINRKAWKVVETKIEIGDPKNPTATKEVLLQNNDIALSAIHDAIDERTLFWRSTSLAVAGFSGSPISILVSTTFHTFLLIDLMCVVIFDFQ